MTFQAPDLLSTLFFTLIVLAVIGMLLAGVYVASVRLHEPARGRTTRLGVGVLLWLGLLSAVVHSQVIDHAPMPALPLFFFCANAAGVALACGRLGSTLARGLPLTALVAFHIFRLPLELVLHHWASMGSIPQSMTWSGQNWDIVTGLAAFAVVGWPRRPRVAVWGFNVLGSLLLLNVMRVAVFSAPLPFAWPVQPPLLLPGHLPYAWIVPVCVAGALAGHIVLTRALFWPPKDKISTL